MPPLFILLRLFGYITRVRDTTAADKSTFTCYIFECNSSGEEVRHGRLLCCHSNLAFI